MEKRRRTEVFVGLIIFAVFETLNHIIEVPDFVAGVCLSLVITLELIGAMPENAYNKLKSWKKKYLFHRI